MDLKEEKNVNPIFIVIQVRIPNFKVDKTFALSQFPGSLNKHLHTLPSFQ